ncbi:Meiotically protein [Penicillium canariense]|uniref:Meiotically protein n=1 Tax=Penicillium canariense TaxID=189055 RepID=A0A9W9I6R8_9EURO|nr:Meiotically protein [Penicillium canariense]KAJ5167833.1 Meiotically protein [Penicillium canariense]
MENRNSISLVDNTVPSQQPTGGEALRQTSTIGRQGTLAKHLSRTSVSGQLAKRKYAKWQPDRLGLPSDTNTEHSLSRESSRARGSVSASSSGGPASRQSSHLGIRDSIGAGASDVDTADFAPSPAPGTTNEPPQSNGLTQQPTTTDEPKILSELDILYENQRGWFFFGVPLYSHSSLLNLDPSAWMTKDKRDSPVNITNAQVPDPSWEWAWRTWYVDMSGDVDDQGWQYAFSFGSSQWHGTHPWFHSFVRRRRWLRLRTKIPERRHPGRSEFEKAHMLNEDYFTIHSSKVRSREQSIARLSRTESGFLSRLGSKTEEEAHMEEIGDIPSLLRALKQTSIDRARIDALKKFVEEGGEELYYLNDKIPEIMPMFLFQASRWQFIAHLTETVHDLSQQLSDPNTEDKDKIERKRDSLSRAAESGRQHITGPEVFTDTHGHAATGLLDLTPVSRHDTLLSKRAQLTGEPLRVLKGKEIEGIPKKAEVGREGHIY